uniref:Sugar ABC transporter permease n=1 Tax=Dictyoglomus thermophilum TaxID=14 RepID=A0A7C3MJB3_DICTH
MKYNKYIPYLFILPWIIGLLSFTLGPLIFSCIMSFYDWPIVGKTNFIGLKNYIDMFQDPLFYNALKATFRYVLLYVPLNTIFALFCAILINPKFRLTSMFKVLFFLPTIVSGVAIAIVWSWIYDKEYGILNYFLSLLGISGINWLGDRKWSIVSLVIASLWTMGNTMLIFLAALKNVPIELYEAAYIDGATNWQRFLKITLPMISPSILFNLITTLISAFQVLTLALLLTGGGPARSSYVFAMYVYHNAFRYSQLGYAAANAWFMFIIIFILTMILFKTSNLWVYYEAES